jgi:energy-coupling factor transport system ATP-binding protein
MTVRVADLRVTHFGAQQPAVKNLSFELGAGQVALLLGPSGAGKSTLLLALSGVLGHLETAEVTGLINAPEAGLLLQNSNAATVGETVFRDVAFGAESAGLQRAEILRLVPHTLAAVGLESLDDSRDPQSLSGGELQRVCLAGLVSLAPKLLLLDEPTAMLDAASADSVRLAVLDYLKSSGATAIVAEHRFTGWLPIADRILVLDDTGGLVANGPAIEVMDAQLSTLESWGLWTDDTAPAIASSKSATDTTEEPRSGKLTVFVGPSGSGKTTRLNAELELAQARLGSDALGWLPQNPVHTIVADSVLDTAAATAVRLHTDGRQRAEYWIQRLNLEVCLGRNPHELSGGEQRRLALASALAHAPKDLFLDEPTVGLDRINWAAVVEAILEVREQGANLLVATHDPHLIALADEVIEVEPREIADSSKRRTQTFSPLAMLVASAITLVGALFFSSLLGALVVLAIEGALLTVALLSMPQLGRSRLLIPIAIGVLSVGFSNWWLSGNHDVNAAVLVALRVAFFGLPGLLFASVASPAALGDQLGQQLRLPARPVIAAIIGLGRAQRLQHDWRTVKRVREIRGVARGGFKEIWALLLVTLIEATRSAQVTAIALETRGFSRLNADGKPQPRSWAIPARFGRGDAWLLLGAVLVSALGALWR